MEKPTIWKARRTAVRIRSKKNVTIECQGGRDTDIGRGDFAQTAYFFPSAAYMTSCEGKILSMKKFSIFLPKRDLHRAEIVFFDRGMLSIEL